MTPLDALQQQNRRRLIIGGAACAAILVITGIAVVVSHLGGGGAKPAAAAVTPSETWTPLTWAPATSAAPPATTAAVGAAGTTWTPCPGLCPDNSADYSTDSCTAAQYSEQWGNNGLDGVVDAMIENKLLVNPERLKDCPQYLPAWQKAETGFSDGTEAVPGDVRPGTYETTSSNINDCYWERGRNGQIVANNFITGSTVKQRVTIRSGDDTFVTRNCGDWVKVG